MLGNKFASYEPLLRLNTTAQLDQLYNLHLIQDTCLQINFIMSKVKPTKWEDIKQFTWDVTLGQVGGILGLWLGLTAMSILTVVECIYTYCTFDQSHDDDNKKSKHPCQYQCQCNSIKNQTNGKNDMSSKSTVSSLKITVTPINPSIVENDNSFYTKL